MVQETRLDNGLDVIVVANGGVPLATVLLAVRTGAFTQDSAAAGLAHLFEHMLIRSYGDDPLAFAIAATQLEGRANGETRDEVVFYYVIIPSRNVDGAIALMAHLVRKPHFSQEALNDERPIVLDELARHQSHPDEQLERQVQRKLWGESWGRKDMTGDSTSLAAITLANLKATYARYYVPNNAALIVTGDVSGARVVERARREFNDWRRGPDPFADRPVPPTDPLRRTTVVLVAEDVPDVTIRVALQGPSVRTDTTATYAADALFDILNDPSSSFQQHLVDEGPFQFLSGWYLTLDHTGPIELVGKTTPAAAWTALVGLLGQLDSLPALTGTGDGDVTSARNRRRVERALAGEQIVTLAPQLAFWWSSARIDYFVHHDERLAALSSDDLQAFERDYVRGRPRVIGVLGPPTIIARLAALLQPTGDGGGP